MNKLLAFTVPLSLILVACTGSQPGPPDCVALPTPNNCVTTPNGIGINYNTYVVTPPNYCAEKGQDIEVRVTPRNGDVGTVTTEPKPGHPGWLAGTNDPDRNGFVLHATDEEGEHKYNVIFSDGCIIDPRITI